jgi:hypothetical protein
VRDWGTRNEAAKVNENELRKDLMNSLKTERFRDVQAAAQDAVNWKVLEKEELTFDDPQIVENLFLLKEYFLSFPRDKVDKYLLGYVVKLLSDGHRAHVKRIELMAEMYFVELYNSRFRGISFSEKEEGTRLGVVARVETPDEVEVFYIKTHSSGLLLDPSRNSASPVDPRELLVYKLLEVSGMGCEAHLFGRDLKNFYIGTKSAGKTFSTFEAL